MVEDRSFCCVVLVDWDRLRGQGSHDNTGRLTAFSESSLGNGSLSLPLFTCLNHVVMTLSLSLSTMSESCQ